MAGYVRQAYHAVAFAYCLGYLRILKMIPFYRYILAISPMQAISYYHRYANLFKAVSMSTCNIKVLDKNKDSATFWDLYNCDPETIDYFIKDKSYDLKSLDKELQDNVKTTLDHNEYSFRKRYIDASEQDKQNVIILYDAILDQLTEDGYMTKEDAAKRKAEWKT